MGHPSTNARFVIMKLIFATSNEHKLREIRSLVNLEIEIISLKEIGFVEELPETQDTIEGNSLQKAEFLSKQTNTACFAEDTGLIIDALNGEPGVYSARYAGEHATFHDNVNLVLDKMKNRTNRKAQFKTVITYYSDGSFVQFEGITEGEILVEAKGAQGFGYDPIFKPEGASKSYAEMTLAQKNTFSHRKKSFDQFANYLRKFPV
jgi:XTP/dITP diphosphohydrolase